MPAVAREPDTSAWFALRLDSSTFGIFDAFPGDAGRDAHLAGGVAERLFARAEELFAAPPAVRKIDVLADTLPAEEDELGRRPGWDASEWRPRQESEEDVPATEPGWDASEWTPSRSKDA